MKWVVKTQQVINNIVELPDDAIVVNFASEEDDGEWVTYMTAMEPESSVEARLTAEDRRDRQECKRIIGSAPEEIKKQLQAVLDNHDVAFSNRWKYDTTLKLIRGLAKTAAEVSHD